MFAALFTLTLGWGPAILAGTGLTVAIALPAAQAGMNATRAKLSHFYKGKEVFRSRITIFTLHLLQPLARLVGRIGGGLTPWRRRATRTRPKFLPSQMKMWRDRWEPPETTLRDLYTQLRSSGTVSRPGSDYDSWDLEIRGGLFGRSRLLLGVEDHPPGKQLLRYRIYPTYSLLLPLVLTPFAILSLVAGFSGAWLSSITSGTITFFIAINALIDSAFANGTFREFLKRAGAA